MDHRDGCLACPDCPGLSQDGVGRAIVRRLHAARMSLANAEGQTGRSDIGRHVVSGQISPPPFAVGCSN